jgi:hypothetical protein
MYQVEAPNIWKLHNAATPTVIVAAEAHFNRIILGTQPASTTLLLIYDRATVSSSTTTGYLYKGKADATRNIRDIEFNCQVNNGLVIYTTAAWPITVIYQGKVGNA